MWKRRKRKKGKWLFPFSYGGEEIGKRRGKGEQGRREGLTSEVFILVVSVILAESEGFSEEVYLAKRIVLC